MKKTTKWSFVWKELGKYAAKVSVEIYCFKQYEIIRYFFKNRIGVTDMIDVL